MEGHLRGIIAPATVEEIVKEPEMAGRSHALHVRGRHDQDGLEVFVHHQGSQRQNDYISNMGRPDIARIKRDADVAAAERRRDTASDARRRCASRRSPGRRPIRSASRPKAASMAKQADAQRELEVKKALYMEGIKKQQAQPTRLTRFREHHAATVVAEFWRVQQIEKQEHGEGPGAEIPAPREGADRPRC